MIVEVLDALALGEEAAEKAIQHVSAQVNELCLKFPIYDSAKGVF